MTKSLLDDPEHWRKRARETAAKAEVSWRPGIKERLLKVVEEYEAIARRAELNAAAQNSERGQRLG
jgi:hypothetical protein